MFQRSQLRQLKDRIEIEPRRFIQVLFGPRQVGKTTLAQQFIKETKLYTHYISADAVEAIEELWIEQNWNLVRLKIRQSAMKEAVLIIDEIQKIPNWSEHVKKLWDEDSRNSVKIKVLILGSSRLLLQKGLTESLAGRYESIYIGHWSSGEMKDAFNLSPESFVWYGGYPGSMELIRDENRWKKYVLESLIETSVSKDILMMTRVDKPALMKRLFELGCSYSGQILSFTKILGQLHDAGNTTTLSHYLDLLDSAGLLAGIEKFSPEMIRRRASSPKFNVHNTALISAQETLSFQEVYSDPVKWGRWVESAVGAHLLNHSLTTHYSLFYWRHINDEIDFVLQSGQKTIGLEVKSGGKQKRSGMRLFKRNIILTKCI